MDMNNIEKAQAAYDAARERRNALIDHPDKTVPVDVYRNRLAEALAEADLAHADLLAAHRPRPLWSCSCGWTNTGLDPVCRRCGRV